jgi:metallo-beta-lactamase class B
MRIGLLVLSLVTLGAQQTATDRADWNKPVEPFKIIGDVYYVGAAGVSAFLIRTDDGLILLDGALPETAPRIARNIATLGFDVRDVRILLNSHAHYDHGGGLAELKRLSGASLVASAADAPALEAGDANMPPVRVDRRINDGDRVSLGGAALTAHLTPGHTKGCTTWTTTAAEAGRTYEVLFHCSTSVVDVLVGNTAYPTIVQDYERTFAKLRAMKADVFLTNHPFFFDMDEKAAAKATAAANPFVDASELQRFNARQEQNFKSALEKER